MSRKTSRKKNIRKNENSLASASTPPAEGKPVKKGNLSSKGSEIDLREPWIKRKNGIITVLIIGVALAGLVAYQIIKGSGDWGQGILWGLVFGASIVGIFFFMNWFHSLFNKNKDRNEK